MKTLKQLAFLEPAGGAIIGFTYSQGVDGDAERVDFEGRNKRGNSFVLLCPNRIYC
jgi:hypothetical protein